MTDAVDVSSRVAVEEGEVLTRTRILEHVWDFAYDPASNVVDQWRRAYPSAA